MTLRKKTLFAISVTMISLMVVLYLLLSALLMGNYADLEEQQTRQNMQRVVNALERELEGLTRTAEDWAAWNETRDFVLGTNNSYVTDNLMEETFLSLRLNLMVFYDDNDQVVLGKAIDLASEQEMTFPQGLLTYFATHNKLLQHSDPGAGYTGIIMLSDGPLLTAIYPVSSNEYGPIVGTLVFGRYLNDAEVERLEKQTDVALTTYRWDDAYLPDDVQAIRVALIEATAMYIQPLSQHTIAGYTHYLDILGQPALILRIVVPRDVHAQGQTSLHYMLLALLVSGLVFGGVTLLLIEHLVLARLVHLSTEVAQIKFHDMPGAHLKVKGEDELSHLAEAFNQSFAALKNSYYHQQQMTEQLLNSRNLLRTIFDTISDGLLLLDHRGHVQAANQAMAAFMGHTPETLFGVSWESICQRPLPCGSGAKCFFSGLWVLDTLHDGQPRQHRVRIACSDNTTRVFDMQALPIYQPGEEHAQSNTVHQVVLHVVDVTEQLHMEVLMVENERLAASRRLSQIVAHEVNSPLQTIMFSLEILQDSEPHEQREFLSVAQREIERIGKILHQLKDLYHRSPELSASVDVNTLIERVLLLTSGTLNRCEIVVERHLAPDLPLISGRGDQLMQVLLNLTLNAIDSMPEGGSLCFATSVCESHSPLQAQERAAEDQPVLRICVSDTGAGIELADLHRIFEPFFTTKTHGSGLGLAVSQKIIEEHQGHIDVQSNPGKGTTFTIHLPLLCTTAREP